MSDNLDMRELALKIIKDRKSIRSYSPEPVSDEDIRLVLEAARWAPSGENAQPWRFIVIRDEKTRRAIGDIARGGSGRRFTAEFVSEKMQERFANLTDPDKKAHVFKTLISGNVSAFMADAPVMIIVCGFRDVWDLPFDTAAATENLLLMAAAIGLGACWVIGPVQDVRDEERVGKMLDVPPDYKIMAAIGVGHPSRIPNPRPRKPLEELAFAEKFGQPFAEARPLEGGA